MIYNHLTKWEFIYPVDSDAVNRSNLIQNSVINKYLLDKPKRINCPDDPLKPYFHALVENGK